METLRAGRWIPLEICYSSNLQESHRLELLEIARRLSLTIKPVSTERLTDLCHSRDHQGIIAKMPAFPFNPVSDFLKSSPQPKLLVIIDSIHDPFNIGAICRSAQVLGAHGVILHSNSTATITPQTVRSSAGAISQLPIAETSDLKSLIASLQAIGCAVIATTPRASVTICDYDMSRSIAVLIGNEAYGIADDVLKLCTTELRIPQFTNFDSLNAAVATGIVLYEIAKQRGISR